MIGQLMAQLKHPDAAQRADALHILAMVEETEALAAIRAVYEQDPHEGVRQLAGWAGKVIWQAQQRGHSTAAAMRAHYGGQLDDPSREELFVTSIVNQMSASGSAQEQQIYLEQMRLKRELFDAYASPDSGQSVELPTLAELAADILAEED
jgi:hypothetical protein